MRAIRAIICDLDGTLVRSGNIVLQEDVEMLREARSSGIRTTLITGRPSRCLSDLPEELLPLFANIFTCNGASSVTGGKPELVAPLDVDQGLALAMKLRGSDPTVAFAVELDGTFGYEPGYAYWPATDTTPAAMCAEVGELLHIGSPVTKILCRSGRLNAAELALEAATIDPGMTVTYSCRPGGRGPVEVLAPHASKGHAVRLDLQRARIDPRLAVAFGDGHNDLPMLSAVGIGIAVGEDVDPALGPFDSATSVGRWLAENQESWNSTVSTGEVKSR